MMIFSRRLIRHGWRELIAIAPAGVIENSEEQARRGSGRILRFRSGRGELSSAAITPSAFPLVLSEVEDMLGDTLIPLLVKVLVTAATVVAASVAAERAGPVVGGVIVALPVSAGPGYVFLARQASDAFIARSALYTLAITAATALLLAVYVRVAPRLGAVASVAVALLPWFAGAITLQWLDLSWGSALGFNLVAFPLAIFLTRDSTATEAALPRIAGLRDLLLRAVLAGGLVATIVTISNLIGPRLTGSAVTFPVMLTTLGLIMHYRYGGRAAARALRGALLAMPGFAACALALHLLAETLGAPRALVAALGVSLAASLLLLFGEYVGRRRADRSGNKLVPLSPRAD
jgi:hypothetical protein